MAHCLAERVSCEEFFYLSSTGLNRVHVFQLDDEELQQKQGEMQWVPRIARALTEDRFVLYCQTILDTHDNLEQNNHYEIWIRLIDEDGDVALPVSFIPAAERYSLMPTIDRWVIRKTFSMYKEAYQGKHGKTFDTCAINLSGESLSDDKFLDFINEQFAIYDIPLRAISFEITETAAISNLVKAIQFIKELRGRDAALHWMISARACHRSTISRICLSITSKSTALLSETLPKSRFIMPWWSPSTRLVTSWVFRLSRSASRPTRFSRRSGKSVSILHRVMPLTGRNRWKIISSGDLAS